MERMLPTAHEILMRSVLAKECISRHKRNMENLRSQVTKLEHERKGEFY